jgi:hypothetical protein
MSRRGKRRDADSAHNESTERNTKAAQKDAQGDCQAKIEKLRCELELNRLRREEQEAAEQKKLQQKEREQDRKDLRRQQRREARHERWKAFWERKRKRREAPGSIAGPIYAAMLLGIPSLLALGIYSLTRSSGEALAIGLFTASAAFAVGALFGFLFGIPRSSGAAANADAGTGREASAGEAAAVPHFTTNTNLEQISDWLTKILVGVGLVQIHQVSGAIEDLADGLAPGLGAQGFSVAVALLVAFVITGFITGYLFTRLRLPGALELASVIKRAVKERADTETTAIALVQQQLTPGTDKPPPGGVVKALKAATRGVRQQAFYLARRQRSEEWGEGVDEEEKKELVRCAIPVFQALIASAPEIPPARLHAEIGHTHLRMEPPDFAAAKSAFDEAIRLRPDDQVGRFPEYELNRAYCTIGLDGRYAQDQPSPPPVVESVRSDLEPVINLLKGVKTEKYDVITEWLAANSKTDDERSLRLKTLRERFAEVERIR